LSELPTTHISLTKLLAFSVIVTLYWKMSPSAYSQGFGRRRRSLSLGRYDDERFYDQSFGRDCYGGEGSDRYFGGRRFGGRDMNRFDDTCYEKRYGSSFEDDCFIGNRFHSRRRSQSFGRRNSMSRRYSVGNYDDDDFYGRFSGYFYSGPFGMNNMNLSDGGRLMNMYPGYERFGNVLGYPRHNRFGHGGFAFNNSDYNDYANDQFYNYRFN